MDRVIVVGGGAAGMMAAVAAAEKGGDVCLIEKNEKLGKKLFITGKGRCNVTNAADMDMLFDNVRTNAKFLYSAFYDWDNRAVMEFLERAGCALKTERGGRVFPVSDHSSDVIGAFQRELKRQNVEILLRTEAEELVYESGGAHGNSGESRIKGIRLKGGRFLPCDSCIVCTGGLAYPATGSTGDGYRFAEAAGHQVTPRSPALVPFNIKEKWCERLMGLSLKNVSLCMERKGKTVFQGFGEMLFTHFGVSGPLVLSASSFFGDSGRKEKAGETKLHIDLKPALDIQQLDRRLLRDFEKNKGKQFKNALGALLPGSMAPVMVELSRIDPNKKVDEITREERKNFAALIKDFTLTVTGTRGFEEAVITRGGVQVREVNPSTMESRLVKGLYFAGEVLDLDALTGGYNLQIAWSTAHLAGYSCVGG